MTTKYNETINDSIVGEKTCSSIEIPPKMLTALTELYKLLPNVKSDILCDMFKSGQLVPTVVQEIDTNEVLMLAYSNIDSLMRTIQSGYAHYYSRSRAKLWKKGETSGNVQTIISIASDCDNDTILFKVLQKGVACHTGSHNCFFNQLYINQ